MTHKTFVRTALTLLLGSLAWAQPAAPKLLISCQGRLFDGKQLLQGEVDLRLRVYNQPTGGDILYEDRAKVQVLEGIYATFLGDDTVKGNLADALASGQGYLEVVANGIVFAPRERLGAEAYALVASRLPDGAVTAGMLGPEAVQAPHIADGAITPPKLSASYWTTGGNTGEAGKPLLLGTLGAEDLVLVAHGKPSLRLQGEGAFAVGPQAQVKHPGAIVLAAGQAATSTAPGQIILMAPGNVGIGTASPSETLTVAGGVLAERFAGDGAALTGITAARVADAAITDLQVAPGANIDPAKIRGGALTGETRFDGQVQGAAGQLKIKAGAITAEHLAPGVLPKIPEFKIEKGTITAELLAPGVIPAIPEFKIGKGTVTAEMLAPGVLPKIPEFKIEKGSITADHLAKGVIPDMKIAKGSITADLLAPGVLPKLPEFKIEKGTITADLLAPGVIPAIPEFKIGKGAVTAEMLAPGVLPKIPEFKIEKGTITADLLAPGVIPAIPEFKIGKGAVTAEMLAPGVLPTLKIEKGSITADLLAPGVIPKIPEFQIEKGSITADMLAKGAIPESRIAKGSITADLLAPGLIPAPMNPRDAFALKSGGLRFAESEKLPVYLVQGDTAVFAVLPAKESPNLVAGFGGNVIGKDAQGATISGGGKDKQINRAEGKYTTVGGGLGNTAGNEYATVGGGFANTSRGSASTVAGGWRNQALELDATVGGGQDNTASGFASTVSGGFNNQALGNQATIAGGLDNVAKGDLTFVAGRRGKALHNGTVVLTDGQDADFASTGENQILLRAAGNVGIDTAKPTEKLTVAGNIAPSAGGQYNLGSPALRWSTLYLGKSIDIDTLRFERNGEALLSLSPQATSLAGLRLYAGGESPRVVGGHAANDVAETAVGGVIAGGGNAQGVQKVSGQYGSIGGGIGNQVSGFGATIAGGQDNRASGTAAAISGGFSNVADGVFPVIGGGVANRVTARLGVISGGYSNLVEAAFGVVAGGALNEVSGDYGFAAGRRAKVRHPGSFVWADAVDADVTTSARNQFVARASGGIQFFSNGNQTTGVLLPPGSGSWAMLSDANQKEGVRKVDPMDILERLAAMPLYTWRYRGQAAGVTHLGPTAQDFHAAFGLGEHATHISAVDADGVALGAIQALHGRLKEKDAEIGQMRAENESLRQRLERLEKAIGGLLPAAGQE